LVFYAFDLLHLDGLDLRGATLLDRKHVLAELLADAAEPIRYSEHVEADGALVLRMPANWNLRAWSRSDRGARHRRAQDDQDAPASRA
jgi:bifunctional non-homologous end joining protein LigD